MKFNITKILMLNYIHFKHLELLFITFKHAFRFSFSPLHDATIESPKSPEKPVFPETTTYQCFFNAFPIFLTGCMGVCDRGAFLFFPLYLHNLSFFFS